MEEPTWIELPEAFRGGEELFEAPSGWGVDEPEGAEWVVVLVSGAAGGDEAGEGGVGSGGGITDPEWGGRYTLKVYGSEVVRRRDGEERKRVVLRPDSHEDRFETIVLERGGEDEFEVLGGWSA